MRKDWQELVEAARAVCGEMRLRRDFTAGEVAAALRTQGGRIHTGVCISLTCGLGFCAEASAMAEMLKHRESRIAAIVAVAGDRILPPCGRCREMMIQVDAGNAEASVLVAPDRAVPLRDLLPDHWL